VPRRLTAEEVGGAQIERAAREGSASTIVGTELQVLALGTDDPREKAAALRGLINLFLRHPCGAGMRTCLLCGRRFRVPCQHRNHRRDVDQLRLWLTELDFTGLGDDARAAGGLPRIRYRREETGGAPSEAELSLLDGVLR
jgi:hypothetical protein